MKYDQKKHKNFSYGDAWVKKSKYEKKKLKYYSKANCLLEDDIVSEKIANNTFPVIASLFTTGAFVAKAAEAPLGTTLKLCYAALMAATMIEICPCKERLSDIHMIIGSHYQKKEEQIMNEMAKYQCTRENMREAQNSQENN